MAESTCDLYLGVPLVPPGSRFRLTGLGIHSPARERGAGRGQMEMGRARPFSLSFSLSLLRRECFYFIRSKREEPGYQENKRSDVFQDPRKPLLTLLGALPLAGKSRLEKISTESSQCVWEQGDSEQTFELKWGEETIIKGGKASRTGVSMTTAYHAPAPPTPHTGAG